MSSVHELVFATSNPAKLAQMAYVIETSRARVTLIAASERYGDQAAYAEQGATPSAIVQRAALEVARRLGVAVLVEDTTFHVEALGGAPGVHAGKYLKEHGRAGILHSLRGNPHRVARIASAACWATPDGDNQTWVTILRGVITMQEEWIEGAPEWVGPSASNPLGGGYNAIFIPTHEKRTMAQITPREALMRGYREPNFSAALHFVQSLPAPRVTL